MTWGQKAGPRFADRVEWFVNRKFGLLSEGEERCQRCKENQKYLQDMGWSLELYKKMSDEFDQFEIFNAGICDTCPNRFDAPEIKLHDFVKLQELDDMFQYTHENVVEGMGYPAWRRVASYREFRDQFTEDVKAMRIFRQAYSKALHRLNFCSEECQKNYDDEHRKRKCLHCEKEFVI